jgi:hypothetical protein
MSFLRRVGRIETSEDPRFERAEWRWQRVGWALMAIVVVAAGLGAFGDGPLADTRVGDEHLAARYQRLAREAAPTTLTLTGRPEHGVLRVWIARAYLDGVEVERIEPEPERVVVEADRHVFEWPAGGESAEVRFELLPSAPGWLRGRAGSGDASVALAQWVFP